MGGATEDLCLSLWVEYDIILLSEVSRPASRPTKPSGQWMLGTSCRWRVARVWSWLFASIKCQGLEWMELQLHCTLCVYGLHRDDFTSQCLLYVIFLVVMSWSIAELVGIYNRALLFLTMKFSTINLNFDCILSAGRLQTLQWTDQW